MYKLFVLMLLTSVISGCSSLHLYDGPKRDINKLAHIYANSSQVLIQSIDGTPYDHSIFNLQSKAYILPGEHEAVVQYNWVDSPSVGGPAEHSLPETPLTKKICFNVISGAEYSIETTPIVGDDWDVFIQKKISFIKYEKIPLTKCE